MKAEIISVGTEILLGDILNTNAQFLSRELADLGIDVYFQAVVGDNPERLKAVLENSFARADLVITTGGLGPTADDLTKETGAAYFGLPMELDEHSLKRIEKFFRKIDREMTDNNIKQAYVPKGAVVLKNGRGTAPGMIVEKDGKILIMLPGPPGEVVPMFNEGVRPYLESRQEYTFVSRILRIADVGESAMEHAVRDLLDGENPTVAPYAKPMESYLRITAKAKTRGEAEALIAPVAEEIYSRFGEKIYAEGETTLEDTVAEMLMKKNMTIAVAESLTGGLLSSALVEHPGISKVFLEGVTAYSNESKIKRLGVLPETLEKFGAVSAETAEEMARGAAKFSGAEIGISTTGIAGPDGGTTEKPVGTVYIGLCIKGRASAKKLSLAGTRGRIRDRSVYLALDWLRKELLVDESAKTV